MKQHGGKRKRSGRKPISDKKIQVPLFIQESILKKHGGFDRTRDYLYSTIGQVIK